MKAEIFMIGILHLKLLKAPKQPTSTFNLILPIQFIVGSRTGNGWTLLAHTSI
jgi:hypothetical protein